jgi:peptide deformylase
MNMLNLFRRAPVKRMRVVTCGHPALRKRSAPIDSVTADVAELAERMIVTMFENEITGIGLAAPQVGVNIRLITVATQDPSEPLPPDASPAERMLVPRMPIALVNPEIVASSDAISTAVEGCLSIPELSGDVERPVSVTLRAGTLDGETFELECGGLLARCIQHEIDHLDGILFIDRLDDREKEELAPYVAELEKRERQRLKRSRKG